MEIKTCEKCGRIIVNPKVNSLICDFCKRFEQEDAEKVQEYLRTHPYATVDDIHRETGVAEEVIFSLVRRGSIEMIPESRLPKCIICGKPLREAGVSACAGCRKAFEAGRAPKGSSPGEEKCEGTPMGRIGDRSVWRPGYHDRDDTEKNKK